MAFVAAQDFLYDTNSPVIEKRPPPISIQLLITNQCTTQCKMCNHFSLYNRDNELTHLELLHTLDCISNLGTRSIIISGGEPLSYPTLPELLQYGKDKGLIIGLLTNGIMTGGNPIDNRHAKTILKTCEWVQLSIDSFEDSVYTTIRGKDLLNVALESLNRLMGVGFTNLELCFTIQKDNIHEVPAIVRQIPAVIPPIIPIRFKFGHGPNNRRGFLCSSHDIQSLIRQLPNNSERTNSDYLLSMIRNNYFDYDGISNGMPLQNTMSRYRLLGYQCKALNLSCKIDANGDVYPCCFLFDDNRGVSTIRPQYKLGSIRNPRTGTVLSPSQNGGVNALNEILNNNERLQQLQHKILPIDNEACSTCTRHFYQNEFLNKVSLIYYNCHNFGVAESIFNNRRDEDGDPFWV
jgi:MoaA/NifB/PqqE/SkfB family radical SAM enzyme